MDATTAVRLSLADADHDPLANRTDRALSVVKRGILTGRLRPGQQLIESEIAEMLGMSKTPVREALKTLVGSGLVSLSRYKGAVVRELDSDAAAAVYDLRVLLEPEAVRRTVTTGGDLGAASSALDRAVAAGEAGDEVGMSLANRDFHRSLYLGCGNPLLVATLDGLKDQTALVSVSGWRAAGGWRTEAGEHRAILDAALAGDGDRAAGAVREHITGFVARVLPRLGPTVDPSDQDGTAEPAAG
ncbi:MULTISPECIES: GntR family transcriptional regulator [unclassified Pseudonocardia]|jgi:DNA-binding GntR family transcriptional regulator|uniref:GntR family transcriptional regulator n=1 Tax=unclassified Pseudonocardia TaxID=2619320 RepID=UPI0001FFED5D|nr:GntR family transcriptional regulator [Pseudonocardia sp. Ae707_Ps1]OLM17420.1 putative regulator PutR for proline utilization, GntR family [Pseudonocardia sp. Ae707_Ps1]